MKKLFTSLMLLAAAFTASAELKITAAGDVTLTHGSELNVGYTLVANGTRMTWDPEVIVTSSTAATLTVSATATTPAMVQFCGLDDKCQVLSSEPVVKSKWYGANDIVPLAIDIARQKNHLSSPITVNVSVTDGTETVNFTLHFVDVPAEEASINGPQSAANALRMSHRTLHYSVDTPTQLAIFNMAGRQIINRRVSTSGSINLASVPAGVYVYRLGRHTGKLIIR